ncbi:MAG: hypothetical protein NWE89_01230 [Candidatus Bathyarchaeota archaeon]|nr:hypothetical protein [Candidatus Bathyarchaeota archaeon]
MKRGKPSPQLDDVAICVTMGWTSGELNAQPSRFVERLRVYLEALADERKREDRRLEDEIQRLTKGR